MPGVPRPRVREGQASGQRQTPDVYGDLQPAVGFRPALPGHRGGRVSEPRQGHGADQSRVGRPAQGGNEREAELGADPGSEWGERLRAEVRAPLVREWQGAQATVNPARSNAAWVLLARAASSLRQRLMYVKAVSMGDAVPHTDFDATVHSVFESAVNLCLTAGGGLLTLVGSSQADLPQGIRVDIPENFSFEIARPGEQATCRNGLLRVGSLALELRNARRWKCDLPALRADMTNPAVANAWRRAWHALSTRQGRSGYEVITENLVFSDNVARPGTLRKVEEAIRDLVDATGRYDSNLAREVGALIGLGAGLTPSCDDLLAGYLAGLWCAVRGRSERVRFISDLGKEVLRLSSTTTRVSRTYLQHATRGQVSSLLVDLAGAICQGEDSDDLLEAAEAAMRVGHTSGMAAVAGLLLGLAVWNGDHLLNGIKSAGLQASPQRDSL